MKLFFILVIAVYQCYAITSKVTTTINKNTKCCKSYSTKLTKYIPTRISTKTSSMRISTSKINSSSSSGMTVSSKTMGSYATVLTDKNGYHATRTVKFPNSVADAYISCFPPKGLIKRSGGGFTLDNCDYSITRCCTYTHPYPTSTKDRYTTKTGKYVSFTDYVTYPAYVKNKLTSYVDSYLKYTSETYKTVLYKTVIVTERGQKPDPNFTGITCSSYSTYSSRIPYIAITKLDKMTSKIINTSERTKTIDGTVTKFITVDVPLTYYYNEIINTDYSEGYITSTTCELYSETTSVPTSTKDIQSEITDIPSSTVPIDEPTETPAPTIFIITTTTTKQPPKTKVNTTTTSSKRPPKRTTTTTTTTKQPPKTKVNTTTTSSKRPPKSTTTTTTTTTSKRPPKSTTTTTITKKPITTSKCVPTVVTVTVKEKVTITKKETITVTVTDNSEPTPETVSCAKKWEQCGGTNYSGPTCCESGSTCRVINPYYSQCV